MNEIRKIHLGRQAFTISIDAYTLLERYLHAIKEAVGKNSQDVVEEVELRMAELLTEKGIRGDKVILREDVEFLKTQLGKPGDFKDEDDEESDEKTANEGTEKTPKRLFRDTNRGMIAGVAAGLAAYVGINPWIVRAVFIFLTLVWGWGILLYIILWLLVPEAKTSSAILQMRGKAVTVGNLKNIAERADVPGAARRASASFGRILEGCAKVLLTLVGIGVSLAATALLFGVMTASIYLLFNDGSVFEEAIFPVGSSEVLLLVMSMVALGIFALLLLLTGIAMVRRKWQLPGWGVASLMGLLFVCLSVGGALTADIAPKVHERYRAAEHTVSIPIQEFTKLHVDGKSEVGYIYKNSATYGVDIRYRGIGDASKIKTELKDQTLTLDIREFADSRECKNICLFHEPRIDVEIRGPQLQELVTEGGGLYFTMYDTKEQSLRIKAAGVPVELRNEIISKVRLEKATDGFWNVDLTGQGNDTAPRQYASFFHDSASASGQEVELKINEPCALPEGGGISIGTFQTLTVNGKIFTTPAQYDTHYDKMQSNIYNCVSVLGVGPYTYPESSYPESSYIKIVE